VKQPGKQKERLISPRKTRQASAMSKRKEVTEDDRSAEETRIPANDESPEANPSRQSGSTDRLGKKRDRPISPRKTRQNKKKKITDDDRAVYEAEELGELGKRQRRKPTRHR
jgi:hypothetical protein